MDIPSPPTSTEQSGIPNNAAEFPEAVEAPELKPFLISFADYNKGECGINSMDVKRGRKALKILNTVGMYLCPPGDFDGRDDLKRMAVEHVRDEGDYRRFYSGLRDRPDLEIKEIKIDADKGRLFFFIAQNIFSVVAITDAHPETDKKRR